MKHARDDYNRIQDPAGKIGEDEPVFLIRAQDQVAPMAVMAWAEQHLAWGGDPMLADLARAHARLMRKWQKENRCKPADL